MTCHYWFFKHGFNFRGSVCTGCHDLMMFCLNISDVLIITVKYVNDRCINHDISKSETIR